MSEASTNELEICDTQSGVRLSLHVTPRANKNIVNGIRAGKLSVSVRALPAEGAANQAVIETLAHALGIAKSKVQIVRGHNGREKVADVDGLSAKATKRKLGLESNGE